MFRIRFDTENCIPDQQVTVRTSHEDWQIDIGGVFQDGAWIFTLDESDYQPSVSFKFVLDGSWMTGENITISPLAGQDYRYDDHDIAFVKPGAVITENGHVQQLFFKPDYDSSHVYDVIVIGSGMGGGVLADQLSDAGQDVLIIEAGSLLFPTHVANLARRLRIGQFDKHIWGLWPDMKVQAFVQDTPTFGGGQAFNLGGRSLFWGGLIPKMGRWELASWPTAVRDYLLTTGYRLAEDTLNRNGPIGSEYQRRAKEFLKNILPEFDHLDAPVAVQYSGYTPLAIPGGMFSTADLLLEDRLVVANPPVPVPTINLNHAAQRILFDERKAVGVQCYDLLGQVERTYHGRSVVVCCGTIESAKLALLSGVDNPLIGKGITDHPIWYTHFALPAGSPHAALNASAKVCSRYHSDAEIAQHPYNMVVELGADFNQGRYVDPDDLTRHLQTKGDFTLCEIVFLLAADLVENNQVSLTGPPAAPVRLRIDHAPIADSVINEIREVSANVLAGLGAQPIAGDTLELKLAELGAVAHEVGTLRMGAEGAGVVDENLRFWGYENLYACDNSVFPTSPAANPSLTLVALALRLAQHLSGIR
ncbi:GMC oxidoreductase [Mycobacterium attenuatum]|uniref:GMC oxidoreductase n=1 Tax=Mycobacterium attenuatum TaxID=2341086 RepID=UPI000F2B4254|nr:GMC family oxidoreductase [Mycobacterium attenuatum]VBA57139.1 Paromamine 6'-oxidase [Mycobacterium attenuatum]